MIDLLLSEEQRALFGIWRHGEYQFLKRILSASVINAPLPVPRLAGAASFQERTTKNMTDRKMNYWLRSGAKSDYGIPIEARAPFLDFSVVEFCCQLPPEYLIHDGWHKYVLRKAVEAYLPEEVVWRRQKMGFPFPFREWLTINRDIVFRNSEGVDCPYLDVSSMFRYYKDLVRIAPLTLWRLISLMLWWRRVIEGRKLCESP
jgi:asparagine synthase (glutamine-hydrolysing)